MSFWYQFMWRVTEALLAAYYSGGLQGPASLLPLIVKPIGQVTPTIEVRVSADLTLRERGLRPGPLAPTRVQFQ